MEEPFNALARTSGGTLGEPDTTEVLSNNNNNDDKRAAAIKVRRPPMTRLLQLGRCWILLLFDACFLVELNNNINIFPLQTINNRN